MKRIPLVEVMPFQVLNLNESEQNGVLVVSGRVQRAGVKNRNRRVYPVGIWERIATDQGVLGRLERREMAGVLDHPKDGVTRTREVSHLITKLDPPDSEGWVNAIVEVLDTEDGEHLKKLFRNKVGVGISSRGSGSIKRTKEADVVQEDYVLETFDFVMNPSTIGANPKPELVTESFEETNREFEEMNLQKRLEEIRGVLGTLKGSIHEGMKREDLDKTRKDVFRYHFEAVEAERKEPALKHLAEAIGELTTEVYRKLDEASLGSNPVVKDLKGKLTEGEEKAKTFESQYKASEKIIEALLKRYKAVYQLLEGVVAEARRLKKTQAPTAGVVSEEVKRALQNWSDDNLMTGGDRSRLQELQKENKALRQIVEGLKKKYHEDVTLIWLEGQLGESEHKEAILKLMKGVSSRDELKERLSYFKELAGGGGVLPVTEETVVDAARTGGRAGTRELNKEGSGAGKGNGQIWSLDEQQENENFAILENVCGRLDAHEI